jgi:hypothetical protein
MYAMAAKKPYAIPMEKAKERLALGYLSSSFLHHLSLSYTTHDYTCTPFAPIPLPLSPEETVKKENQLPRKHPNAAQNTIKEKENSC